MSISNPLLVATFLLCLIGAPAAATEACDPEDARVTTTPALPLFGGPLRTWTETLRGLPPKADAVIIGDSIARSWTREKFDGALGNLNVVNLGIGGDTTQNVLHRLANEKELESLAPRSVYLIVGTNNLFFGNEPCAIAAGVEAIVNRINALWDHPKIHVFEIFPRGRAFNFKEAYRVETNRRLRQIPATTFVAVDERALTCQGREPCNNYLADSLHFTKSGYFVLDQALSSEQK